MKIYNMKFNYSNEQLMETYQKCKQSILKKTNDIFEIIIFLDKLVEFSEYKEEFFLFVKMSNLKTEKLQQHLEKITNLQQRKKTFYAIKDYSEYILDQFNSIQQELLEKARVFLIVDSIKKLPRDKKIVVLKTDYKFCTDVMDNIYFEKSIDLVKHGEKFYVGRQPFLNTAFDWIVFDAQIISESLIKEILMKWKPNPLKVRVQYR